MQAAIPYLRRRPPRPVGIGLAALCLVVSGLAGGAPKPPAPTEALPTLVEVRGGADVVVSGPPTPPPEPPGPPPGPPGPPAPADMVSFPAGPFVMGCTGELPLCADDREPVRTITLSAFAIERRPVTQGQYAACVKAGGCEEPAEWAFFEPDEKAERPVVGVTWTQAGAYCRWAGRRLPTEAEWVRAARGTAGRLYPWGPTDRVLRGGATPEGVEDLIGSVKQWVADWYTVDGYARLAARDPTGDPDGTRKALRGLESMFGHTVPATFRADRHPEITDTGIGVRCALSLGPRTPTPSAQPPPATVEPWPVLDVAAGEAHTCAVDLAGRGWCWGDDTWNQLAPEPIRRPRLHSLRPRAFDGPRLDGIEAGPLATCAHRPDGWTRCWGKLNAVAALGQFAVGRSLCGITGPAPTGPPRLDFDADPFYVFRGGPPGRIACAAPGAEHMRLLLDPDDMDAGLLDAVDLAVGHAHGCAVDRAGQPWCWGDNPTGQLGVDGDEKRPLPVRAGAASLAGMAFPPLLDRMGPVVDLAAGSHHTCALHRSGQVSCWGRATYGATGQPSPRERADLPPEIRRDLSRDRRLGPTEMPLALPVPGIDDARLLVDGQDFTCVIRADGSLWCWGDNHGGQLGDGTIASRTRPAKVEGLPGPVLAADGGRHHLCAIVGRARGDTHGALYCWGENDHGQLGDGTRIARRRPVAIAPADRPPRGRGAH